MSLHDAYARRTPFELAFPDSNSIRELIAAIEAEAVGRGADPADPHAFVTMGAVAAFVATLQEPESPAEAVHRYGALVYHAVHFEDRGSHLFLLDTPAARYLVEGAPDGVPTPPASAGYLQLPQHLFWVGGGAEAPESIDGLFWTVSSRDLLHVLVVTGVRPDRDGFGTVPIPEAPVADAASWLDASVRESGDDFAGALPGGELDRLYSVEAAGEVLKLLARFFAYVSSVPDAVSAQEPSAEGAGVTPASVLPYQRVALHA